MATGWPPVGYYLCTCIHQNRQAVHFNTWTSVHVIVSDLDVEEGRMYVENFTVVL